MTKLNLTETSLLEASGELDSAAQKRLLAYFIRHPEARAQYETIKGELDLLRSLPLPVMSAEQKRHYASSIKAGVHRKFRHARREENAAKRMRFIYGALAGIASAAAVFVVAGGIWSLNHVPVKTGGNSVAVSPAADGKLLTFVDSSQETSNTYDEAINNVQQSIDKLQSDSPSVAGVPNADMSNLLDALSTVPGDTDNLPDRGAHLRPTPQDRNDTENKIAAPFAPPGCGGAFGFASRRDHVVGGGQAGGAEGERDRAGGNEGVHEHGATTAAAAQKHKEEEIAKVMEFFKATQPDVFAQAQTLRETDPARFEKLVRPVFSTVNRLEDLKKKNPKLFDLTMQDLQHNYQSLRMSRELKKPDLSPADRDKLLSDLNLVVSEQFDIRLQIRQQEIDDLTKQLNGLSEQLQANQKDRDAKIAKRVNDLVEKTPKLDW